MTVVSVCSAKHSPGATTLALALLCAWQSDPASSSDGLLVEADPVGGDLAARLGLAMEPGLVSMAASARHGDDLIDVWAHSQALPAGGYIVLAPTDPTRSSAAVTVVADRLCPALRGVADRAVVDVGRWWPGTPTTPVLARSDVVVLAARPDLAGIEHVRVATEAIQEISGALIAIALIGDRPYGPDDVLGSTTARFAFALPVDRRSASGLHEGPIQRLRRSPLVRATRSIVDEISSAAGVAV